MRFKIEIILLKEIGKKNHETQGLVNLMLNDKIDKKNQLKKDLKKYG